MSLCTGSVRLGCRVARRVEIPVADLPAFLCPGIIRTQLVQRSFPTIQPQDLLSQGSQRRRLHSDGPNTSELLQPTGSFKLLRLPLQCAGCGAFSQTVNKGEPGFYSSTRRSVREYLGGPSLSKASIEDEIVKRSLQNFGEEILKTLKIDKPTSSPEILEPPICDRCHNLKHHESGISIYHPSIQSIQETILESPYKYNHVYHVVDAADFPMSLVPGLHKLLDLTPQRSFNRRSKTGKFYHGKKTEVSFIITRSDLLAPLKTQVDALMPYLTSVLRDALGRWGQDARLGNVRCVSAIRGWWTPQLKEEIWARGGGGWMVGKVNVGKSQLFQNVFPKGRRGQVAAEKSLINATAAAELSSAVSPEESTLVEVLDYAEKEVKSSIAKNLSIGSLLPPARPETNFPLMPLVSALPGTTASPIRVPFGNGKGELIDLPGLSRGDLERHVLPEHRSSLVMRSRTRPKQQVIKPGQSLLLGGFIRITPKTPDLIILAYAFIPIESHLTSTEKAIGTQMQTRDSALVNIALPGVGEKIASAGTFYMKWDVTKQRTGPITARDAAGIKVERLPYRVYSTDILIEGCGWVELVAQVRKPRFDVSQDNNGTSEDESRNARDVDDIDPEWPAVEVFTPEGKFIASRRPMNAWLHVSKKPATSQKGRPRKSMKGAKKAEKRARRMTATS